MYNGNTGDNLRSYFKDAQADFELYDNKNEFYLIISDEIDAICRKSGSNSNSDVHDNIVNVLLITLTSNVVLNQIKNWFAYAETQFQLPIKSVKCDNGTEFKNTEIDKFFKSMGVIVNYTVPGHPEGNGVAERKIQTLKNKANCLLHQVQDKTLSEILFNEALHHATYLVNITPYNSSCEKCPMSVINGKIYVQLLLLRFGEKVISHSIESLKYKNHVFIGYPKDHSQGYKIFDPQTKKHYRTTKIKSLIEREIADKIKCNHIKDKSKCLVMK